MYFNIFFITHKSNILGRINRVHSRHKGIRGRLKLQVIKETYWKIKKIKFHRRNINTHINTLLIDFLNY